MNEKNDFRDEMDAKVDKMNCPNCDTPLLHFSGLEYVPEFYYCPKCSDKGYNEDMEVIMNLTLDIYLREEED